MAIIDELVAKIRVVGAEELTRAGKEAEKAEGIMARLSRFKLAIGGAAILGGAVALKGFTDANLQAMDAVKQLSAVTGASANLIYEMGKVAEVNGSSVEASNASIEGLSRIIGEAATGVGRGAKMLEAFGLTARDSAGQVKSVETVLGDVMDRMQSMSEAEQVAMLSKLGIDKTMIQTLRLGRAELVKLRKERELMTLGVGSDESAEVSAAYNDGMTDLMQMMTATKEYLALKLAPSFTGFADKTKQFFIGNSDTIKAFLNGFTAILGISGRGVSLIDRAVSATIGWQNALIAIGVIAVALNRKMLLAFATNPIVLAVTAVAGLILIIDDLMTYLDGGDSKFGEFWQACIDWTQESWQDVKQFFDSINTGIDDTANYVITTWDKVVAGWQATIAIVTGIFEAIRDSIKQAFADAFDTAISLYNATIGKITGTQIEIGAKINPNINPVAGVANMAGAVTSAQNAIAGRVSGGNAQVSNSSQTNNVQATINVQGAGRNAQTVGAEVAQQVRNLTRQVVY